ASCAPLGEAWRTRASNRAAPGVSPRFEAETELTAADASAEGRGRGWRPDPAVADRVSGARPAALGPAARLPSQLLLQRPDDKIHHRDVGLHAVQLELTMQLFRNAGRQLDPDFPLTCHNAPFAGHGGISRICI